MERMYLLMDLTLYRLNSKGKPIQWQIKVTDNVIETWDGQVGGKLKYTEDVVSEGKNIGKSNETTPEEQALSNAERKVTLKRRKGYQETIPTDSKPKFNADFFNGPPRNFVGPKPLNKMPDSEREKLADRLVFQRKWNGMCVHIVIGLDGEPRIYTSAMDEKSDSFPRQIETLRGMNIKPGSWFMAEAVYILFNDGIYYDDCDRMKTVFGHSTEKAVAWQEEHDLVQFQVFNCLFHDGEELNITYEERHNLCLFYFAGMHPFDVPCNEADSYEEALSILKTNDEYEGYVMWNLDHKTMPIKWGGAPSRRGGAWKLKNFKEADVLIIDWETGKGKLNDDVATLTYGAYGPDGGIVPMGRGGSGLDGKLRAEIAKSTLPIVAEVKFEEITKAGKFRLPVILRTRTDKRKEECTVESIVGV
jgi:ATP-dependent DNA ligase